MKKKISYVTEIIIGIFIIWLINMLWFQDNIGFAGVSPHPYWIIVIFMAVRYGSLQGMVAGIICSVVLLLSVSYNTALESSFESFKIPYKQIQLAGLFIIFGFLIGEERRRINKILADQKEKYNKLRNEFGDLAMENMANKNINVELEGRILGQADTVNTLYKAARNLANIKADVLYPAIVNLITQIISPDKCSLYVFEGDKYVLKGYKGWKKEDIKSREILNIDTGIIKLAMNEKRLVTVKDIFKSKDLSWEEDNDPPMVAPLSFGESKNTVGGFILIDKIPFLKLNPDSMRFLSVMSDWISKSLDNAYSLTAVRAKDYYDKDLKVFNYSYAQRRMKEEFFNVEITGKPSTLMLIKLRDFDELEEDKQTKVLKTVAFVLKNTFRSSDVVARYTLDDTFMVVLPGTDGEGASVVDKRVKEEMERYAFKPFSDENKILGINVSTCVLGPAGRSESELFKDAEKALG